MSRNIEDNGDNWSSITSGECTRSIDESRGVKEMIGELFVSIK